MRSTSIGQQASEHTASKDFLNLGGICGLKKYLDYLLIRQPLHICFSGLMQVDYQSCLHSVIYIGF